jgi:membrane protease subunit HflK
MEEILPNIEKVIIEGKAADRMLPYLPLDRMKPRTGAAVEGQNP